MHASALQNAIRFFEAYVSDSNNRIIEIGSQDVNGSIRNVFKNAGEYIGVDFVTAPGVDLILQDPYEIPLEDESVDIVICSSVLEHSEFFWVLFLEIIRILKPSGLFYLNVPSNGSYHRYPVDCWRFYPDSGVALEKWGNRNGYQTYLLESYVSNQNKDCWNDFVAVFLKNRNFAYKFSRRILHTFNDFHNGYTNSDAAPLNLSVKTEDQKIINASKSTQSPSAGRSSKIKETDLLMYCIDQVNGDLSINNHFSVKGWAIPKVPDYQINLALSDNGVIRIYPLNEQRPNVITSIMGSTALEKYASLCGFNYSLPLGKKTRIGFECRNELTWIEIEN